MEIENAVEVLPKAEQEALLHYLATKLEKKAPTIRPYRTSTHPGGVLPGIDPDKLGQLAEDI